ncbi:MAG TPA: threonine ammonia-lyase [Actinomycetota bacterium]|nr:threonine ammonia-lyase [Actinomycetota bacterium]
MKTHQVELVGLDDIRAARERLRGVAVQTPVDRSRALSAICGSEVFVKCENLQRTGSFKIRGAYNRIVQLSDDERAAGVVAASAGNHAQGVALAASLAGIDATVYMPAGASLPKAEATKRYGATVVLEGHDFGAAFEAAEDHAARTGAVFVHPFDHPHVIAGQGTIGLEISEQMSGGVGRRDETADPIGTVVVPIGGGGLIAGISAAVKSLHPSVRVVGVQASGAASFPRSLAQGSPVTLDSMSTIADGIAANRPGDLTLAHVAEHVDDVVCVSDDSIAEALVMTAERMKLVLEPAGAAGVAAVTQGLADLTPPVVVILSGGNIDPLLLLRVMRHGLSASGRYLAFRTRIPDKPGELYRLLGLIADMGANVVGVEHHREGVAVQMEEVEVTLQIETKGGPHIQQVTGRLASAGYSIERL